MTDFNFVLAFGLISVALYRFVKSARTDLKLSRSKAVIVALGQMLVSYFVFFGSYFALQFLFAYLFPLSDILNALFFLISFGLTAYTMKKLDSLLSGA